MARSPRLRNAASGVARTGRGRSADEARTRREGDPNMARTRHGRVEKVCCGGAGEHVPGGAANGATACVQRGEPLASRGFSCKPSPSARL